MKSGQKPFAPPKYQLFQIKIRQKQPILTNSSAPKGMPHLFNTATHHKWAKSTR